MAKLLVQREKRLTIEGRSRVMVDEKVFFVSNMTRDFQTASGFVKKDDLSQPDGSIIKTNTGQELILLTAGFPDAFDHLRKLPQTVMRKDVGMIIAMSGVGKDSVVLDAGAGSGALVLGLARVCKHVTTYEVREDFIENIKANIASAGVDNVTLKHADIGQGVVEKDMDLVTLDMPEPWTVLAAVTPSLKLGGFLACYLPTVPQVMECVKAIEADDRYLYLKTIELIERPWIVQDKRTRPDNEMIGHTAFLIFARKIQ